MSRASRLTMIPLAALSASLLMPQVTMAASLPQQQHQQQHQQQATCSNFAFLLSASQAGLSGLAAVTVDTTANTVSVQVLGSVTVPPIQGQLTTNTDGSLTITIPVNGTSSTFKLSWQSATSILVTPGTGSAFTVAAVCLDTTLPAPTAPTAPTSSTSSTSSTTSAGTGSITTTSSLSSKLR